MLAVGRKLGAGAAVQRVGTGRRFRQGISADDLSGSQPRQIFLLLLFGAEINDGQRADAGVSAPGGGEARVLGDVVGDDGGGDFVHFEAAVGFGNFDAAQSQVASLLQQIASDGEILVLHLLDVGQDFVDCEFLRGLPDQLMLLGEILRRENLVNLALFEQKAAARDFGAGNCSCGSHSETPLTTKDTKYHEGKPREWDFLGVP